ncbi:Flp pilus assembly complex ATPase component TadA, partial [Candidatus Woesearchaeota archaeon]|nr:Flp pilus assembly complex ATPase component TadA [Candidatus Woesearchaeota archaeon]
MAEEKEVSNYEVLSEGGSEVLKLDAGRWPYLPSLEDNPIVMSIAIDRLSEMPSISGLIFHQVRNYTYDEEQTRLLVEVANIYKHLLKQKKVLSLANLGSGKEDVLAKRYAQLQYIVMSLLRTDPLGCYVECKRLMREEKIRLDKDLTVQEAESRRKYIDLLNYIYVLLDKTKLVNQVRELIEGYKLGSRDLYREIFRAVITPDFMYTKLAARPPSEGRQIDAYSLKDIDVVVYKVPNDVRYLYHVTPPEFKITEDEYMLLDLARTVLAEHKPKEEEFLEPDKMRRTFTNIGIDLIQELANTKNVDLNYEAAEELAKILVRYTVGFGLIEVLLQDPKIQDIVVNGPIGETPVFIVHQDYGECVTNIIPSREDADGWASKFRLLSGRPLDEANPVLDTELVIPGARARVAVMGFPLSPHGLAYALRRHRDEPWTLPLFIENKMISPLGAGLMSFLIDGARSIIIAGTRSSGKTSILGAMLVEIMRKYRIITVEGTLELSTDYLKDIGYNIQPMKVREALTSGTTELGADEGIRTSLRLGDSALIVGEVRSSIRGDEEVVIFEDGIMKRIQIKELENKDISKIKIPTLDFDLRTRLSKLTDFVKHPQRKKLLRIKTKTGREVTVTHDHSLFAPTKDFEIAPIECKDLKVGDQVVIPSYIPCGFNDKDYINVFDYLPEFRVQNFEEDVRKAISTLGWKNATEICNLKSGDIYNYFRENQKTNIPFESFSDLMNTANLTYDPFNLMVKKGTSLPIPAIIPVNEEFCRFLGYYVSEGYYSLNAGKGGNVVITNSNPDIVNDITNISKNLFKLEPAKRYVKGLGNSMQHRLSSLPLAKLVSKLGCGRLCYEKRVPSLIFGLNKRKIASFLRALYSGDGNFTSSKSAGNSVRYFSTSKKLVEDVSYLLLNFGIVARIRERKPSGLGKHTLWILEFKDRKMVKVFLEEIGFVRKIKDMVVNKWPHTKSNYVKFDKEILKKHLTKYPRKNRHLFRFLRCSKNYLENVVLNPECEVSEKLKTFALGDFYL